MPSPLDITGKVYNKLVAIRRLSGGKWECLCACGKLKIYYTSQLTRGRVKSCGCVKSPNLKTGEKFGNWTVISEGVGPKTPAKKTSRYWTCSCVCGEIRDLQYSSLVGGSINSCGCLRKVNTGLDGRRFGRLLVVRLDTVRCNEKGQSKTQRYLCICDCGKECLRDATRLRTGWQACTDCIRREKGRLLVTTNIYGEAAFTALIRNYEKGARERGYEYSLSRENAERLFMDLCHYCGDPPSRIKYGGREAVYYNGIDRIDNTKGYVSDNCVTCCFACNSFKSKMDVRDFLEHVNKIFRYQNKYVEQAAFVQIAKTK